MSKKVTIVGVCSVEHNPCLTKPCLPGLVLGVKTDEELYFILHNGRFVEEGFHWEGVLLKQGDILMIKGVIDIKNDIDDKSFSVIEIKSLIMKERE